eukprot:3118643-Rhodomonas_salina.1
MRITGSLRAGSPDSGEDRYNRRRTQCKECRKGSVCFAPRRQLAVSNQQSIKGREQPRQVRIKVVSAPSDGEGGGRMPSDERGEGRGAKSGASEKSESEVRGARQRGGGGWWWKNAKRPRALPPPSWPARSEWSKEQRA